MGRIRREDLILLLRDIILHSGSLGRLFSLIATYMVITGLVPACELRTDGDFIVLPYWETKPLAL